jgi:membrane protease YdiL (CAAX protease family)
MFRTPGAAWLMFGFGVTFAPIFEEIAFRGFLLPSLATAWDWVVEKSNGSPAPLLDVNGHPQWTLSAMVAASIVTSLPFALMHAEQTGWSWGPFVLLMSVSLILCGVRLKTRSLAASTLVHACYNFILFSTALISSGGFRHLDKM